jgi:hypothetical protein
MRHTEATHFFLQHDFGANDRSEDETNNQKEAENHGGRSG